MSFSFFFFSVSVFLLNFPSHFKTFSLHSWIFQLLWYHSCRGLELSLRVSFPGLKLSSLSVYLSCLSGPWNLLKIGLWNSGLFLWHFSFLIRWPLWSCEFVDWSDGVLCFPCVFLSCALLICWGVSALSIAFSLSPLACFSFFYVNLPGALSSLGFMFTGWANLSDNYNGLTEVPVLAEGEDTVLSAPVPYKVWRREY